MNLVPPAAPALMPGQAGPPQRLLLSHVGWHDYVAIGNALRNRPALRLTYDRGSLEIMTTSPEHERYKKRLGRLLELLVEEFGLAFETAGNMTFRREDLERGLEPDDCFWIANERRMRTREEWDPRHDPPPDLVLEIEIAHSALDRMASYAALGVPEVWRFDGASLQIELLQPDGTYRASDTSPTFPGLPVRELTAYVQPNETMDFLSMVRAVRAWVHQNRSAPSDAGNDLDKDE